MKRLSSIFVALIVAASPWVANAAVSVDTLLNGIPHQALFSVDFDGDSGVAVGAGGEIVITKDKGKTWTSEKAPSPLSLLGVATKGQKSIAVGQMGEILLKDGSNTWKAVESGSQERLLAVALNPQGKAIVVGSFGTILTSANGGESWVKSTPDWAAYFKEGAAELGDGFVPHLYAVQFEHDCTAILAGEPALIMRTEDCGATWKPVFLGYKPGDPASRASFFAIQLRPDGLGYAVGQNGLVVRTANGGSNWDRVDVGSTGNLLGVGINPNGNVTIVAMHEALTSRDQGRTWKKVNSFDIKTGWYNAVTVDSENGQILAVGHSGRIIRFVD